MAEPVSEMVIARPSPRLRHLVHQFIGYYQRNVPITVHRGLPSRHITLVIGLGRPIRLAVMPDPSQPPGEFEICLGGLHPAAVLIEQDREQCGIHVELNPLGAHELLGVPAEELSSQVLELADLPGKWMTGLTDRLAGLRTWTDRFAVLDRVLCAAATDPKSGRPQVAWAWQRMLRAGGAVPINELAGEVGWSRRHFAERFRREVGLTPKQAARVVRFERARALLQRADRINLADLAATCGYHDQAHMTNEWRALAGCTPGTWIAEELPFLQYAGDDSLADWQHD
ncbi:MAG: helix-turn-helix domain-containing protein [Pseudonocardiaceae bacterium]|nr:helix-turn-helix domain-containing protein [Pseudonocardiaceae bacterium]